jgi:uncharacterized protein (DUF1778 family)
MKVEQPRITARVDLATQELLKEASSLSGISSINAFVLSAAIEKAKRIIDEEKRMKLSYEDAQLLVNVLDAPIEVNTRLSQAMKNYNAKCS